MNGVRDLAEGDSRCSTPCERPAVMITRLRIRAHPCWALVCLLAVFLCTAEAQPLPEESRGIPYTPLGADTCLLCHRAQPVAMEIFNTRHAVPTDSRGPFGEGQLQWRRRVTAPAAHMPARFLLASNAGRSSATLQTRLPQSLTATPCASAVMTVRRVLRGTVGPMTVMRWPAPIATRFIPPAMRCSQRPPSRTSAMGVIKPNARRVCSRTPIRYVRGK